MEFIVFDEEKHQYTNAHTGEVLPSVTQIIGTVYGTGLENAPSYFVERAAEKGTIIHEEIDAYLRKGKLGRTPEFVKWHDWFTKYGNPYEKYESELIVYAKTPYGSFAGKIDFLIRFVTDWKTSKTSTRQQVKKWQMQMSMYVYAARKMGKIVDEPMKIVHITENGVEVINVDYLGDEWVENTVKMYYEGQKIEERPETSLQTVDQNTLAHFGFVLKQIAELEKSIEPIREQIKSEMEKRGILALKAGDVSITYVSPTTRETFDTKRFKDENAGLYEQYKKTSEVKSSIRIKIKGE